ncbi:MAG: hypothetical protein EB092_04730, partial [Chitinophagia bacterium]|nr:hypothetical protein [Chitinophagia bacterium]
MKNILLDIKLFAVLLLVLGSNVELRAQGCVAIRTVGGLNTMEHSMMHGMMHDSNVSKMAEPKWELNISGRYFKSYKHFNGTDEQTQRVDEQTDVRNFSRTLDISLLRKVNEKWSIGFDLPLVYNERSSLYEHVGSAIGNPRFSTFSQGIGDIRIAAYKWLIAPRIGAKGNLLAGIGLKMPTGNFKSEDIFHYKLGSSILTRKGPVDQSIQPGDGGWGMTIELNAFRQLNNSLSTYGNVYYLINPKGNNGVSTARGGIASASAIKYTSDVMSVPDQYLLRAGTNFTTNNFTLSLGVRYECIPAKDI